MEVVEVNSTIRTQIPAISAPPFQTQSPPFIAPKTSLAEMMMMSPSDMKKAISSVRNYLGEVGHVSKQVDPQDTWLPITESRNGNALYAAFHTLSSGLGVQALLLPLAFTSLGWTWGIISLTVAFVWQLYTLWLLIQLHESPSGTRHSRYLRLSIAAFGEKLGKVLALFPTTYLSGGTCVTLIIIGGGTTKIFLHILVCGTHCHVIPLSTVQCYVIFTCSAVVLAQLPNLNSLAGVSLAGAITAVTYCTLIWVLSVTKTRPVGLSYGPLKAESGWATLRGVLNGLGVIAFAFRGHNLVLEIQGTMPSSVKNPSHIPMWRGVKTSYLIIAMCLFPLAIGGYWAYGNLIPANGGLLSALHQYHGHDTSRAILGLTCLLVVINSLTSFQIYAMPAFDNLEFKYTSKNNRPCPRWLRSGIRVLFGCLTLFVAVALPFLPSLAGLIGGIALPVTLAYPCFMWILMKKPRKYSGMWYLNWVLGCLGMVLSVVLVVAAIWTIVVAGIEVHFFKPR